MIRTNLVASWSTPWCRAATWWDQPRGERHRHRGDDQHDQPPQRADGPAVRAPHLPRGRRLLRRARPARTRPGSAVSRNGAHASVGESAVHAQMWGAIGRKALIPDLAATAPTTAGTASRSRPSPPPPRATQRASPGRAPRLAEERDCPRCSDKSWMTWIPLPWRSARNRCRCPSSTWPRCRTAGRRRRAARHHRPGPAGRGARIPAVLGRRASQHARHRELGPARC